MRPAYPVSRFCPLLFPIQAISAVGYATARKLTIDLKGTAVIRSEYNLFYESRREKETEGETMQYSLAKLALMTGYSTRSLRTFYRQGLLTGTMVDGKYSFSEEDLEHFMDQPFIFQSLS